MKRKAPKEESKIEPVGPVKKIAKAKKKAAKTFPGNPEGQHWNKDHTFLTLRLTIEVEVELRKQVLVKGDITHIIRFAVDHVNRGSVRIKKTRKTGLKLGLSMTVGVEPDLRQLLRDWALEEETSVNAIVESVLSDLFETFKWKPWLRDELQKSLRDRLDARRR